MTDPTAYVPTTSCPATIAHALEHTKAAQDSLNRKDYSQVRHDLYIVEDVLTYLKEGLEHVEKS